MDKKNIIPLALACLTCLLIGLLIGQVVISPADQNNDKINEIKEELTLCQSALEMFFPPLPEEIYNLAGIVMEKNNNFIIIQADIQTSRFPLPGEEHFETQNIKVNLTSETQIFKRELLEELIIDPSEEISDPFQKTFLTINDIEVNQLVRAFSEENIKNKQEFTANEIEIF